MEEKHIGKYAIGENQIIYNALITGLAIGYKKEDLVDYDKINNDEFKKKLSELVGNLGSYWTGVDKAEDLLGKNLATSWGDSLKSLNEKGSPWKMVYPKEGLPCWLDNYSIAYTIKKDTILYKIAHDYINEVIDPKYQTEHILRNLSLSTSVMKFSDKLTKEEKGEFYLKIHSPLIKLVL